MTDFEQQVYEKLKLVPKGRVTTYAALAKAVGSPNSARAIGNALNKNPHAPIVPCHRVVYSNGLLGGYAGGTRKKIALLRQEGVFVKSGRVVDFSEKVYKFK
jgi:methylated-DNA-[protein]-cysteine S-methyltransferase